MGKLLYHSGPMKRYNIVMPETFMDMLKDSAKRRDYSVSSLLRRIVGRFLEEEARKLKKEREAREDDA
jgi:Arc/MetJ-type ribon-helix-helix transcriptional regulator